MLKKMSVVAAFAGALSLASLPLIASANAQDAGTEPPKAPAPSEAGAAGGGAAPKAGAMKKSGGAMKKSGGMKKKAAGMKKKKM